ncbi:uncharacterized protein [Montipora capricornis]|uniref:uncharacterized protein n=1 Tax=Montipora capricornis TaxID=246305 RepID=UPI0035F20A0C
MLTVTRIENPNDQLKRFWELDAIGVVDQQNNVRSVEEEDAVNQFNSSCNFDGDRYEVGLPWKKDHPPLVDNYQQSYLRLISIERNLVKHPEKNKMYCEAVNQYINDGHARAIVKEDSKADKIRYLPHHAVFREDRTTTKCQVVFDSSAKTADGVSLNSCLLKGPKLQPDLGHVMIISVQKRVQEHEKDYPVAVKEVKENMYVDDILNSDPDDDCAVQLKDDLCNLLSKWGSPLTKWASNSQKVMEATPLQERAPTLIPTADPEKMSDSLKALDREGNRVSNVFMAKSRVAPATQATLPRLELLAASITAKLLNYVMEALQIMTEAVYAWSGIQIALAWIKGPSSRWKVFVANRVQDIQQRVAPSQWRFCPGNQNPAHFLTRGISASQLKENELW